MSYAQVPEYSNFAAAAASQRATTTAMSPFAMAQAINNCEPRDSLPGKVLKRGNEDLDEGAMPPRQRRKLNPASAEVSIPRRSYPFPGGRRLRSANPMLGFDNKGYWLARKQYLLSRRPCPARLVANKVTNLMASNTKVADLTASNQALLSQLAHAKAAAETRQRTSRLQMQGQAAMVQASSHRALCASRKRVAGLRKKVASSGQLKVALRRHLVASQKEAAKLQEQLNDRQQEVDSLRTQLQFTQASEARLQQSHDELQQSNADLKQSNVTLKQSNVNIKQSNVDAREANRKLRQLNARHKQSITNLERANTYLQQSEARLKQDADMYKTTANALNSNNPRERKLAEAEKKMAIQEKKIAEQQEEIDRLKDDDLQAEIDKKAAERRATLRSSAKPSKKSGKERHAQAVKSQSSFASRPLNLGTSMLNKPIKPKGLSEVPSDLRRAPRPRPSPGPTPHVNEVLDSFSTTSLTKERDTDMDDGEL